MFYVLRSATLINHKSGVIRVRFGNGRMQICNDSQFHHNPIYYLLSRKCDSNTRVQSILITNQAESATVPFRLLVNYLAFLYIILRKNNLVYYLSKIFQKNVRFPISTHSSSHIIQYSIDLFIVHLYKK